MSSLKTKMKLEKLDDYIQEIEKRNPKLHLNKEFNYVEISSMNTDKKQIQSFKTIIGRQAPSRARNVIKTNDVIYATTRPYFRNVALVPESLNDQICSTGFCVLRVKDPKKLLPEFLYYLLQSDMANIQILESMRGGHYPAVGNDDVLNIKVHIPLTKQQKKIIEHIRELKRLVNNALEIRQKINQESNLILKSVLSRVFSKTNLKKWTSKPLQQISPVSTSTIEPKDFPEKIFKYISMDDIEPNTGNLIQIQQIKGREIKSSKQKFQKGYVLYGKLRPYLNKVVVPDFEGICTTEMVPLKVNTDYLLPQFLGWYLRSEQFVNYAMSNISGTRMPRIKMPSLKGANIPTPKMKIQEKIIDILNDMCQYVVKLNSLQNDVDIQIKALTHSIIESKFREMN